MKFKRITMENFMRYRGRNQLEFSCDEIKNVTVVLGDNTVGKTTLAQAFRFGLYGGILIEKGKKKEDYHLLNKEVFDLLDANSSASVSVEIVLNNDSKDYVISRSVTYAKDMKTRQERVILQKKKMLICGQGINETGAEVNQDDIEDVIKELLPADLSSYFLFDGERWNEPGNDSVRKDIKESVHILTGLSATKAAMYHLKEMGPNSAVNKFRAKISGTGQIYDNIRADIDSLYRRVEKEQEKIENIRKNIVRLEQETEAQEQKLLENQSTEQKQKDYKNLEYLIEQNRKTAASEYKIFVHLFSEKGYQYMAAPMIRRCLEVLKRQKIKRRDIPFMRQETIDYLINRKECICGSSIEEGNSCYQFLLEQRRYLPPADLGTVLGAFEREALHWQTDDFKNEMREAAMRFMGELDALEEKQNKYFLMGKELDKETDFAAIRNEIRHKRLQLRSADEAEAASRMRIEGWRKDIQKKESDLELLEARTEENRKWKERVEAAQALYDQLKEEYRKKEKMVFAELNQLMKKNFTRLFNSREKEIELDEKYNIHLYYRTMSSKVEETNLSEGEKVARNFAFIVSILEYSKLKAREKVERFAEEENTQRIFSDELPIILDGPFSKLGEENIRMTAKVLPDIAEQVILFMLKKDWEYTGLDHAVGARYVIDKGSQDTSAVIRRCE